MRINCLFVGVLLALASNDPVISQQQQCHQAVPWETIRCCGNLPYIVCPDDTGCPSIELENEARRIATSGFCDGWYLSEFPQPLTTTGDCKFIRLKCSEDDSQDPPVWECVFDDIIERECIHDRNPQIPAHDCCAE